jgi:hypothetical protein
VRLSPATTRAAAAPMLTKVDLRMFTPPRVDANR